MGQLARLHHAEADGFVFVHAGIDPDTFPLTDDRVSLWTRSPRFFETERWQNAALDGITVIHGHTPTEVPVPDRTADGRRINVDTGAVYGGALTAVRLSRGATPYFLQS